MKLLILGFSVTADPDGFAARVKRKLESRPQGHYTVITCGVGGANVMVLPEIYSQLLRAHGRFDLVILEIATSIFGQKINDWRREGLNVLYDLCSRIQQGGAKVAFVNLYRDEFDYPFLVRRIGLELAIEHVVGDGAAHAMVLGQAPAPGTGTQALQAHQPLNAV